MKNRIIISLFLIATIFLTYSLFYNTEIANNNSSKKDNSITSKDSRTYTKTTGKTIGTNEYTSAAEKINNDATKNNIVTSSNPQSPSKTVQYSTATEENSISSNELVNNTSSLTKKTISISNFLNNLKCTNYVLKQGETLTQIARKYENTCNLKTSIKLIKSINKLNDGDNLNSGITLAIPESTIQTGVMHPITKGETWYSIAQKYYNTYEVSSITKFLIYINDLPNNDLPLDESIFLPAI